MTEFISGPSLRREPGVNFSMKEKKFMKTQETDINILFFQVNPEYRTILSHSHSYSHEKQSTNREK